MTLRPAVRGRAPRTAPSMLYTHPAMVIALSQLCRKRVSFHLEAGKKLCPFGGSQLCTVCCFHVFQKFYSQSLLFHIGQSNQKLVLLAQGQGLEPRLEFSPSVLELGPLLPFASGDEAEVIVRNPCNFPIEFYSLEFDQQYLLEEKVSRDPNTPADMAGPTPGLCPCVHSAFPLVPPLSLPAYQFLIYRLSPPASFPMRTYYFFVIPMCVFKQIKQPMHVYGQYLHSKELYVTTCHYS